MMACFFFTPTLRSSQAQSFALAPCCAYFFKMARCLFHDTPETYRNIQKHCFLSWGESSDSTTPFFHGEEESTKAERLFPRYAQFAIEWTATTKGGHEIPCAFPPSSRMDNHFNNMLDGRANWIQPKTTNRNVAQKNQNGKSTQQKSSINKFES